MSNVNTTVNTGSQMTTRYDVSKIFLSCRKTIADQSFTNDTYDDIDLLPGTLMGRVSATGKLKPLVSDATDGSQYPVGVLLSDHAVEVGDTTDNLCVVTEGDVAEEKLIIDSGDTLETVIDGRQLRDRIGADTVGIVLVPGTDNTAYDN